MRVTHITHASILIEVAGLRVLSDPWWRGPCFGAQWWNYPRPHLEPIEDGKVDYVYVSHGHNDHYHPATLSTLDRGATVLVSSRLDLAEPIRKLGFEVVEIDNEQTYEIADRVNVRIMETYGHDTLFTLTDGEEIVVNLNDALHAAPADVQQRFCTKLLQEVGRADYLFCGYGVASHFPNCYRIPGKDYVTTAVRRQHYFNGQWCGIVNKLEPKYAFPFAADVALLEDDLFWSVAPTHNAERPTDLFKTEFPDSPVEVVDMAPGFAIENGEIAEPVFQHKVDEAELRREYESEIERANTSQPVSKNEIELAKRLFEESVETCRSFLLSYPYDYKSLIRFRSSDVGLSFSKAGSDLSVEVVADVESMTDEFDLIFTTRMPYFRWCLTRPYGDEVLFVGSGGIFEYASADKVKQAPHVELRRLLRVHEEAPAPRSAHNWGLKSRIKGRIKKALGKAGDDLYDLEEWTVYES